MKFTLRQIQVFLAISRHGSVTRAADELSMSQSACSGALKELETHLETQLFDRIGRRLQINELGKQLRADANKLLEQAQQLEDRLDTRSGRGELKLGATLTIGNYLCIPLLRDYYQRTDKALATLDIANTERITKGLLNFDIDLGMIEGEVNHPDITARPWKEDELVCFASPNHPLAGKILNNDNLASYPWILRESGSGTRQTFNRAFHSHLHNLDILLELEHTEAIRRAVEAGMGISCLSLHCVSRQFESGTLVPLPTPDFNLKRRLLVITHRQKFVSQSMKTWLDILNLPKS